MHDHDDGRAEPAHSPFPAPAVLPLTRPVVAVALGALVGGGACLFLAGMATGLGMGNAVMLAQTQAPGTPAVAQAPANPQPVRGGAIAAEPAAAQVAEDASVPTQRRLVVGGLEPLTLPAPPPVAAADTLPAEPAPQLALTTPVPHLPGVPPRKPDAPVLVARTTAEGGSIAGQISPGPAPGAFLDAAVDAPEVASLVADMRYAIQTGAYGVAANADRQAEELRRLGFQPYTTGHVGGGGKALTIVYAGRYDSRETAESAAAALQKAGIQTHLTALAD
ncbi:SPOR domain-containing protein [Novispirillum sp. DQ9]|uniref:SPOR domain-containing protein n=1 Tax=Novispirillum sp. DQ9 TaxID=3398612 RepID=UPI003C7E40CE